MLRLPFLILVVVYIRGIYADCFFDNYDPKQLGIFLRPFGNDSLIFNPKSYFRIPEEGHVDVYCYSGIENYKNDQWGSHLAEEGQKVKNLTIRCNKNQLDYKIVDRSKIIANSPIRCGGTNANFYRSHIEHCPYDNFVYGLPIMDSSIVLLELCYDFHTSEFSFFRYIAGKRSSFLTNQEQYNPSNIPVKLDGMQKFVFSHLQKLPISSEVTEYNITTFAGNANFELGELVQFEKYLKLFEKFLGDTNEVNSVIWWSSLKNGNWRIVERLIEKEAMENDLEIYAGKSGVVSYPYDDKCSMTSELFIDVNGLKKSVPLLIWHYIKPRGAAASEDDIVILGVNSPFFQGAGDNVTHICTDVCDTISWLEPLSKTRKMGAFGYIFCCKPKEVKNVLDGFPNLSYHETLTETIEVINPVD